MQNSLVQLDVQNLKMGDFNVLPTTHSNLPKKKIIPFYLEGEDNRRKCPFLCWMVVSPLLSHISIFFDKL